MSYNYKCHRCVYGSRHLSPSTYEPGVDAQKTDDTPHNTWSSHLESQTSGRSLENEMYREAGVQETFHHPPSEMWQPSSHQVVWHHSKQTPCSWCSEDNAIAKNITLLCATERCTQCTPRDVPNKFIHEENRFLHSRINSFPNCVRKGTGEE